MHHLFKRFLLATSVAGLAVLTLQGANAQDKQNVEVLHWWTAGGEAAALDVLKQDLEKKGVTWTDMPVAGGAGNEAMTVLRARVTAGNPPTAVQMLGFDARDWAEQGSLGNLDEIAEKEGWDKVIPESLQEFAKYDGHWIGAPVNIHTTNWMWINKAALDKAGGKVPTNWDELIEMLDKFKEQGITPIAHGGQPWQDATVFEAIVLSEGPEFYKKAMIDLDPETLGSDQMKGVFDKLAKLRTYVDDNFSGRDWNLASAMVIEDKAGVQFMGDWAKGEFLKAGKKPGVDFVCVRYPGTQGSVTFNSDLFAMFKVDEAKVPAQMEMASAIESPSFQSAFNVVKGSAPARTDVSDAAFDDCGKKAIADVKEASSANKMFGSMAHGYAAPAAVKNAVFDVVTKHFNGQISSEDAAKELAAAVEAAK
ncbi:ABC transporter substrate-binding protein [Daeguia caeni]|uniref:Probable sugar-binding periplasmic protein n=1 Tax=Daeguia caeni TaxID=439612 RepID=A0ABV9H9B6_9HYPH